jgi:hypothetical protein
VTSKRRTSFVLGLALLACAAPGVSGATGRTAKTANAAPKKTELSVAKEKLETAVDDYKKSLAELIAPLERLVEQQTAELEKVKKLVDEGIVSRREVEDAERKLAEARAKAAEAKKDLAEADQILTEALEYEQLARAPIPRRNAYIATNAMIRYHGTGWHISQIGSVQNLFTSRFGRALPISAYGQTSLHNRLGFNHANAVDVAVHPDSSEGQALIAYLRGSGIPFLAFRSAVPGKATGPHIHIGFPSSRLR